MDSKQHGAQVVQTLRHLIPSPLGQWPLAMNGPKDSGSGAGMNETSRQLGPFGGWRLMIAIGVAALLILWWLGNRGTLVDTVTVKTGSAAEVVYATGVVEPVHWAKVTSLQRKRIVDICKCEGQPVKTGDVLARLDDIEERAVLAELEARLQRLKADAVRLERLVERNITARSTLEEKLTQVDEQEARVAAQRDRIADLALKSPVDGIVLRRDGEVGEIAGTGEQDTLLWVGQPKPLRVVAEINEDDILRVKPEQKVLLRHEGQADQPLPATVDRVTPKGDPDTKTFRAYLRLPDDSPLRIGMSVEANIVVNEVANARLVPAEAVKNGKVIRVVDGRAKYTPVEVGIKGAGLVDIKSGLDAGDVLVSPFDAGIGPNEALRPKQRAGE
jgi:RND family efflux transporter MFP subunit